ncbi:hypothetical protein J6590_022940 [Homalodisca vitripennis]|nr:hypothetical protein J6590_022940 [Homalodisca vitripennis]
MVKKSEFGPVGKFYFTEETVFPISPVQDVMHSTNVRFQDATTVSDIAYRPSISGCSCKLHFNESSPSTLLVPNSPLRLTSALSPAMNISSTKISASPLPSSLTLVATSATAGRPHDPPTSPQPSSSVELSPKSSTSTAVFLETPHHSPTSPQMPSSAEIIPVPSTSIETVNNEEALSSKELHPVSPMSTSLMTPPTLLPQETLPMKLTKRPQKAVAKGSSFVSWIKPNFQTLTTCAVIVLVAVVLVTSASVQTYEAIENGDYLSNNSVDYSAFLSCQPLRNWPLEASFLWKQLPPRTIDAPGLMLREFVGCSQNYSCQCNPSERDLYRPRPNHLPQIVLPQRRHEPWTTL